ncbi:winged helix-turn-helix domain-containing protein [Dokdonella ginsengisoli]|uniref:Winged helix-turn-helix domain-containing protein n=1 Tax=Dokdonella ginsengisoli TaxID=363846 RepID=A0ABV9QYW8_9GAMM
MNLHVSPQRATDSLLTQSNLRLRIGEHVIDVGALRIVTRPESARLTSKAMAVLIELVRHAGATVTREQLLDRVWAGRVTTPDVLTQAIKELRRALADDVKPARYIETIPKVGYRLIASVLVLDGPGTGLLVDGGDAVLTPDPAEAAEAAPSPDTASPRSRTVPAKTIAVAAVAVALIAAAALGYQALRGRGEAAPAARWRTSDLHALTSDPGAEYRPHLSPDATRVAFGVFSPHEYSERLMMRSIEPSQRIALTQGSDSVEAFPIWSPDGHRIAFSRIGPNSCEMFVVAGLGGAEQHVRRCQDSGSNYFDWTPDGRGLVSSERADGGKGDFELFRFDLDSGQKQVLTYERTAGAQDLDVRYSPDGRQLAFRRGLAPYSDLFVMPADGGRPRQVTHVSARIRGYAWAADNRTLVYSSDHSGMQALYAVDVEDGHDEPLGIAPAAYPDAARSGDAVVYEILRTRERLKRLPLQPEGASMQLLAPSTGNDYGAVLSPDGRQLAFASDRSGQRQAWLYDFDSDTATQLTDTPARPILSLSWSPAADRLLAVQRNGASRQLVEIELASRRQRVLSRADENVAFAAYAPDAQSHLMAVRLSDADTRLYRVRQAGTAQESRQLVLPSVIAAQIDPATHSLYYTSGVEPGLHRRALDGDADERVTPDTLDFPRSGWRVVGGRIWYLADLGVRSANLREFDPATGSGRLVTRLDMLLQSLDFEVTKSGDALIFAPVDAEDTDVGFFRLSRTP